MEVVISMPDLEGEDSSDPVVSFQNAGYRKEASVLKSENRKLREALNVVEAENQDLRNTLEVRFPRILLPREIDLRRELLITLHNVLEHARAYGEVVPHFDHSSMGYTDHRTLHRSCNRFADMGLLKKVRSNPSSFVVNEDWRGNRFE